ncbi:YcxB family protein [Planctomycetota bacterium]|nr:YcxB family protein [Planctomycetota bacterium]
MIHDITTIQATGRYNPEEYERVASLLTSDSETNMRIVIGLIIAVFSLTFTLLLIIMSIGKASPIVAIIAIPIEIFVLALSYKLMSFPNYKHRFECTPYLQQEFNITTDQDGISINTPLKTTNYKWEHLKWVFYRKDMFFLSTQDHSICLFPKRFLKNEQDWLDLKLIIYKNFARCTDCEYRLYGSTTQQCPECGSKLHSQIIHYEKLMTKIEFVGDCNSFDLNCCKVGLFTS